MNERNINLEQYYNKNEGTLNFPGDKLLSYEDNESHDETLWNSKGLTDQEMKEIVIPFLKEHPDIHTVSLPRHNIGDEGAIELAKIKTIKSLDLFQNPIHDAGAIALAGAKLYALDLSRCQITDIGVKPFRHNKTLYQLCLLKNDIGDDGAEDIAANDNIKVLDLARNERIGVRGAAALAKNTSLEMLAIDKRLHDVVKETDPVKIANYSREAGGKAEAPSLFSQALFYVKHNIPKSSQKEVCEDLKDALKKPPKRIL